MPPPPPSVTKGMQGVGTCEREEWVFLFNPDKADVVPDLNPVAGWVPHAASGKRDASSLDWTGPRCWLGGTRW
jgi:hypothetical protein